MKRMVFTVPTLELASTIADAIYALGIEEEAIHVVTRDPELLRDTNLLEATELETTDLEKDMDWGIVAGGSVGLLAGLSVIGTGPLGIVLGGGTVLAGSLIGMGLGGWLGKMLGEGTPSQALDTYHEAIELGEVLMLVDVPLETLPQAFGVIKQHCPETTVEAIHLTHDHQHAA